MTKQEAAEALDKARRANATPKRRLPLPYRPFPLASLPPVVREHVKAAAECIGCDVALVALTELATVAAAIGNSRALVLKKGWSEPPCLWTVTVAESGLQKSPAYQAAVGPFEEAQYELEERHKDEVAAHRAAGGEAEDAPASPPRFVTSDATIEAVADLLAANPRGVLLARDELDGWFQSFTKYKGKGGGSDRAQWLQLHSAKVLTVDRVTRPDKRVMVRRALCGVTGTIQPAVLKQALCKDALAAGLGARFLFAMPPGRRRVWNENELPDEVARRYRWLLDSLLGLRLKDKRKRDPHFLGFSRAAKRLWVNYFNEWGKVQYDAEGEERAAFAKIEGYAARLMLVHHVVCHAAAETPAEDRPVTEVSAAAGIEMARWFAYEATRIYAMLAESDSDTESRRLIEFVQRRGGTATVRDLQNSNSRKFPSSEAAEAALESLVTAGLARWVEPACPPKGGNVGRTLELLPTSDSSDSCPRGPAWGASDSCPDQPEDRPDAPGESDGASPAQQEDCRESVPTGGEQLSELSNVGDDPPTDPGSGRGGEQTSGARGQVSEGGPANWTDNWARHTTVKQDAVLAVVEEMGSATAAQISARLGGQIEGELARAIAGLVERGWLLEAGGEAPAPTYSAPEDPPIPRDQVPLTFDPDRPVSQEGGVPDRCREWRWASGKILYAESRPGEAEMHPSNAVEWRFVGEQDWHPIHRNGDS